MPLRWKSTCIDAADPPGLAQWWADLLGWRITEADDDGDEVVIAPTDDDAAGSRMLFGRVPEGKTVKNRLHFDLTPDDQDAEVARAESLGARRVDIGQGSPSWVVLADPEGNEFCILRSGAI
jgi:predicted enzyme related to lactoylglutathione lyase